MGNVYLDDSILTGIGNAIRAKTGGSSLITPADMATEIAGITTGGNSTPAGLVSWSTGTDVEIAAMINGYYNGTYSLADIQSVWSLGDIREVTLEEITDVDYSNDNLWSVYESHIQQTIKLQILDFDHDELATPINNIKRALITVDQRNVLTDGSKYSNNNLNSENGYMHYVKTRVGWSACNRRSWCNYGYFQSLPLYLQNLIKPVFKYNANNVKTTDSVFLLSEEELHGPSMGFLSSKNYSEGFQYRLFETAYRKRKIPVYSSGQQSAVYWLRSSELSSQFQKFQLYGPNDNGRTWDWCDSNYCFAPAFCL